MELCVSCLALSRGKTKTSTLTSSLSGFHFESQLTVLIFWLFKQAGIKWLYSWACGSAHWPFNYSSLSHPPTGDHETTLATRGKNQFHRWEFHWDKRTLLVLLFLNLLSQTIYPFLHAMGQNWGGGVCTSVSLLKEFKARYMQSHPPTTLRRASLISGGMPAQ